MEEKMKIKRMGLIAMTVGLFVIMGAINASADWYTCSINQVGASGAKSLVRLTDSATTPAFTNNWFFIEGDAAKEMLATALTAISMGKSVRVNATGTSKFDDVTAVYILP